VIENRKRYNLFKHHAWAGTALLSVLLAIRILIPFPNQLFIPLGVILIIYILFTVSFTYRYSTALSSDDTSQQSESLEKDKLKMEKKRLKNEAKIKKKSDM
jgi:high-affinity K+ transport system ATPase subunit B